MAWDFRMAGGRSEEPLIQQPPVEMFVTSSGPSIRRQLTPKELRAQAIRALKAWQEALEADKNEQETLETLVNKLSAEAANEKEKERVDAAIRAEWLKLHQEPRP